MTEVISKDEVLRALENRMGKQPMDDEYLSDNQQQNKTEGAHDE